VVNNYSNGTTLIFVGLFEIVLIAFIYDYNSFMEDIKIMLKKRYCEYYLLVTWCFISPVIIFIILVYMIVYDEVPIVNGKPLSDGAVAIGWLIFTSILIPIPLFAVYETYKAYKIRHHLKVCPLER
jgi:Sodium:neurotransmitter symporter family